MRHMRHICRSFDLFESRSQDFQMKEIEEFYDDT